MVGYDEKFESVTLSDLWKYNNIFGGKDMVRIWLAWECKKSDLFGI